MHKKIVWICLLFHNTASHTSPYDDSFLPRYHFIMNWGIRPYLKIETYSCTDNSTDSNNHGSPLRPDRRHSINHRRSTKCKSTTLKNRGFFWSTLSSFSTRRVVAQAWQVENHTAKDFLDRRTDKDSDFNHLYMYTTIWGEPFSSAMASGYGARGQVGRCYPFWLDIQKCLSSANDPSECVLQKEVSFLQQLPYMMGLANLIFN